MKTMKMVNYSVKVNGCKFTTFTDGSIEDSDGSVVSDPDVISAIRSELVRRGTPAPSYTPEQVARLVEAAEHAYCSITRDSPCHSEDCQCPAGYLSRALAPFRAGGEKMKFWTWKEFGRRRDAAIDYLVPSPHLASPQEIIQSRYQCRAAYRLGYEAAARQAKRQGGKASE